MCYFLFYILNIEFFVIYFLFNILNKFLESILYFIF